MMNPPVSALFRHIATLQGDAPWGRFLDAGSGVNSARWSLSLSTEAWTGVTASRAHATEIHERAGSGLRSQDRLLVGDWTDPSLLAGERFDTVLADYLLGAVEGFAPYFQTRLFQRLAPLVGARLYVVGLDPYVVGDAPDEAARLVREIGRLRDACLLLADETPYREFPAEWVADALTAAGFVIDSARRFQNRYREKWVHGQLDMALRRLPRIADQAVAAALSDQIEALRVRALEHCRREGGLRAGSDYVLAARPGPQAQIAGQAGLGGSG